MATRPLEQLHEAMRLTFGWADPHLYAFWRGARWWDDNAVRYDAPFAAEDLDAPTARVTLSEIGLRKGQRLAYVFDFGDEWRAFIRGAERWKVDEDDCYPTLVEAVGVPPPQYEEFEEE